MRIDEKRNLTLPIVTEKITKKIDGKDVVEEVVRLWAFHSPISREVFEQHYRILSATKSVLASKGWHYLRTSGPRIAALTLKDEGQKDAESRESFDKEGNIVDNETRVFFEEIKRLTMVLCPGANGWDMLPIETAIAGGKLDAEYWEEALSGIVFFTCHVSMARKADREATANVYASMLDASISSLSIMEFKDSLQNSTPAEPTRTAQSSIPS